MSVSIQPEKTSTTAANTGDRAKSTAQGPRRFGGAGSASTMPHQRGHRVGSDPLAAADEAEALPGGGLHVDASGRHPKRGGEPCPHLLGAGRDPGPPSRHGDV